MTVISGRDSLLHPLQHCCWKPDCQHKTKGGFKIAAHIVDRVCFQCKASGHQAFLGIIDLRSDWLSQLTVVSSLTADRSLQCALGRLNSTLTPQTGWNLTGLKLFREIQQWPCWPCLCIESYICHVWKEINMYS